MPRLRLWRELRTERASECRVAWLCDVAGLRGVMVRRWARGGVVG